MYLQTLDGQFEDVGRELRGLLEREVAPVDDEDEAVDLQLRVFYQHLQREQDGPQDVSERVPDGGRGKRSGEHGGQQVVNSSTGCDAASR